MTTELIVLLPIASFCLGTVCGAAYVWRRGTEVPPLPREEPLRPPVPLPPIDRPPQPWWTGKQPISPYAPKPKPRPPLPAQVSDGRGRRRHPHDPTAVPPPPTERVMHWVKDPTSKCPVCGDIALDGHITCGRAGCNEGEQRRRRADTLLPSIPWGEK